MFYFLLSSALGRPSFDWLAKQKYTHTQLLPPTLSEKEKKDFAKKAHQYLVKKYKNADFRCTNRSAVHYPFQTEKEELQKTYALETSVCVPNITWKEANRLYMSPAFRSEHMPGVAKAERKNMGLCITSQSFVGVMKPAYMCLQSIENKFDSGVLLYSHLTDSKTSPFQPVYFQEEYILFEQVGEDTLIYRLSINRSRELGSAGSYILRKKSQEYPQQLIQALKNKKK